MVAIKFQINFKQPSHFLNSAMTQSKQPVTDQQWRRQNMGTTHMCHAGTAVAI